MSPGCNGDEAAASGEGCTSPKNAGRVSTLNPSNNNTQPVRT
jgi:hypothetical protein